MLLGFLSCETADFGCFSCFLCCGCLGDFVFLWFSGLLVIVLLCSGCLWDVWFGLPVGFDELCLDLWFGWVVWDCVV